MSFYQWQNKDLLLKLHVQPRAKENSITGIHGEMLKLKIKSPPVDNKANKEIVSYLAKEFNVTKSSVELISGQISRDKRFLIKEAKVFPKWFKELSEQA
ncbi:MAG TPA: YggU family protein [Thiotrichaceae bacterium]|jgi:uncharacterized protein (TIGR00251 family)|nr:YggU family protein [Thiotrichaceae bacterium]HIM08698.1 YggU family protein [Gammaproteobacteria bacterium]